MHDIFIKQYSEIFVDPSFQVGGTWNISLIDENNNEFFPFGMNFKKNLILNNCLDVLVEGARNEEYLNLYWNTIPSFLNSSAVLGTGIVPATVNDTQLTHQTLETFNIDDSSCSIEDINNQGKRIFKKVYNFQKPESLPNSPKFYRVSEIGLKNNWNGQLFTKFLLDTPIDIQEGQWLKLYYNFSISCPAIVNPINVNISSGTFNGSGSLKLAGRFDDIFGSFDSNGKPVIVFGDSPRASFMPFCEKFCVEKNTCLNQCFGTAYILTDFIENFNSINSKLVSNWIGNRLSVDTGTISPSSYTLGNFYRDVEYVFDIDNPENNQLTGGFLFTNVKSNRENTIDGWLWKFANNQIKKRDKKIVINLRQSMARI